MYQAYSFLYILALIFLFPFEHLKRPKELRKRWIRERFGLYKTSLQHSNTPFHPVWIHAVSVGEVIAAAPLINKIRDRHPSAEVIVSTVTDTGQKVAKERLGNAARIIYVPFDLPFAIRNALLRIKPSVFIIMETELWPNTIRILNMLGVPVLLMNGRISEKSFKGYIKLRFFIKDVLRRMDLFCMQNEVYADRIRAMGAEADRVKVTGNFKFDTRPSSYIPEWTKILQGTTIIAGSTHRAEEDLIINAYIKLKSDFPMLNLIIAPRHPERFKEVEELIKRNNLKYIKRSEIANSNTPLLQHSGLIIHLDVIGELASVYGMCDIAIMGGTFIEHGGQNPLEPAYWGKAIVCGPHMENFPFIEDFYKNGGAVKTDADNLRQSLKELLSDQKKMIATGKTAKELYDKNAGAVERAMKEIEGYL
ncbi:MAG: 3-deoxy-D-manno-octulosonic acid transferase [Nitrospirae bacterium]|nr:3-deoxy-D-manno-octulosonic acid transferase [Nitrospirota bacterium]